MNRRSFIKNTALAATMAGIAPAAIASDWQGDKTKKVVFVFRGVSYTDAFNAFQKLFSGSTEFPFLKVNCNNPTYTHQEGLTELTKGVKEKFVTAETQKMDRYMFSEVIEDALNNRSQMQVIHLHHTEIGHSSADLYNQKIEEFFYQLKRYFNPQIHKIVVTADLGRNENLNSCKGRDHSNPTCLETFALYMGGNTSDLKANTNTINQNQVLQQKF